MTADAHQLTDVKPQSEMTRLRQELLRTSDSAQAEVARLTALLHTCTAERDLLAKQLEDVRTSVTWRVGRVVVAPAALARRRRRQ